MINGFTILLRGGIHPAIFLIAILVMIGVVLYSYLNSRKYKVRKGLDKAPLTDVTEVKDGDYVKVRGVVWAGGEKIRSPLSDRLCVYHHVLVERLEGGKNKSWRTIIEDEVMADVILKSDEHYVVLKADSPLAHLVPDRKYESGFLNDATKKLERYLERHDHSSTNWIGMNHSIRYKEGILEDGEDVVFAGYAKWISSKQLKFHVPVEKVLLICESEDKSVLITDDPSMVYKH